MTFTENAIKELIGLLTARPDWLKHLEWYGGLSSPVTFDHDWRVNKGELYDAFEPLLEKLHKSQFEDGTCRLELTDSEIVCCGWFFKKGLKYTELGYRLSPELAKSFYDIPSSARAKGHRTYLPFNGRKDSTAKKLPA